MSSDESRGARSKGANAKDSGAPAAKQREGAISFIAQSILGGRHDVIALKHEASRKFSLSSFIKNPEILAAIPKAKLTPEVRKILLKKPAKTLSGVTPVAVMIRPEGSCGHKCIYCPAPGLAAKSYTGYEPAARRARQYGFDPYLQASSRVKQLEEGGHPTDKCEVIIMGGTFLQTDRSYRESFIKGVYDGLNGFCSENLEAAKEANENGKLHRVVGLTLETRPDVCIPYVDEMLSYGATRVELGVQHADDKIYRMINRGHSVQDVVDSTRELRNAAFKVLYHLMPGLPGSDPKKDVSAIKSLFQDSRFRPDMLKIYPTLVIAGTELERWFKEGKYEPYTTEEAADTIAEAYRYIPKYVRVMRIQRDIPLQKIEKGVAKSNLREFVEARLKEKGIVPLEIRSREIGLRGGAELSDFSMKRFDYDAGEGKEIFLSYENQAGRRAPTESSGWFAHSAVNSQQVGNEEGLIAGFTRLRFPPASLRKEIDAETALIRELHVYGSEVPISASGRVQHRGIGAKLLKEAEEIAREFGKTKMIVISGVGVREYYRKHGYGLIGPYMGKELRSRMQ